MKIAKLTVSIDNTGISYNSKEELKTEAARGAVLEGGKVVRGLGTSFSSQEAKERYDDLVSRSNLIRAEFGNKFGRGPIKGTYIIHEFGDAIKFIEKYDNSADIKVSVDELDLNGSLSERTLIEWADRNKDALKRVPLGRAKEASDEGILALEALASCPALSQETKDTVLRLASEARIGTLKRVDLKRSISLLNVEMDATPMLAPRSRPTAEPVAS